MFPINVPAELTARSTKCTFDTCSVSDSIYGYRPSLAATFIFLALFAVSGLIHLGQGITTKTWFFSIVMFVGCLCEVLGYAGRYILWKDPFSVTGFEMSLVTLTVASTFYSAGIYHTIKQIIITFGASFGRVRPAWYTWGFITSAIVSIVLQAFGAGIAAGANNVQLDQDIGEQMLFAGLILQAATLVVFGVMASIYANSVRKQRGHLNQDTLALRSTRKFKLFFVALLVAYLAILIRCVFQIVELVGGFNKGNTILRDEGTFIGMDSVLCTIATILLNIWHPGWCFPKSLVNHLRKQMHHENGSDVAHSTVIVNRK